MKSLSIEKLVFEATNTINRDNDLCIQYCVGILELLSNPKDYQFTLKNKTEIRVLKGPQATYPLKTCFKPKLKHKNNKRAHYSKGIVIEIFKSELVQNEESEEEKAFTL